VKVAPSAHERRASLVARVRNRRAGDSRAFLSLCRAVENVGDANPSNPRSIVARSSPGSSIIRNSPVFEAARSSPQTSPAVGFVILPRISMLLIIVNYSLLTIYSDAGVRARSERRGSIFPRISPLLDPFVVSLIRRDRSQSPTAFRRQQPNEPAGSARGGS